MVKGGKASVLRTSISTHRQDQGHEVDPVQDLPLAQPVMSRVVTHEDAQTVIELNKHKYANVPISAEHMTNLTSNDIAEAIRQYKERQAREQAEQEQDEGSGDSGQSRRSIFGSQAAKDHDRNIELSGDAWSEVSL